MTSIGVTAINESTINITGLQVAALGQVNITLLAFNGTKEVSVTSGGFEISALDKLKRKMFHSVSPPLMFEPMPIKIEELSLSKTPQFKKDLIDMNLTMSVDVLPSDVYSTLRIEFPVGFSLMPRIAKVEGLTPNFGTRVSIPNILEVYSQQPHSRNLVIDTRLRLEIQNVAANNSD